MDLSKLSPRKAAAKPATLHLVDPSNDKPLFDGDAPLTMDILGSDSDQLREKRREIERRKAEGEEISDAQQGAEMLATMTVGWSGIGLHSVKTLEHSFDNAVKLFLDPDAEWICEQVGPFSRDRRNFIKNR